MKNNENDLAVEVLGKKKSNFILQMLLISITSNMS